MKVVICADYSAYTEKLMQAAKLLLGTRVPPAEITVLHIVDTTLFSGMPDSEQLMAACKEESDDIYATAKDYLGNVNYIEEYGVPLPKLDELLESLPFDILIIGSKGKSALANVLFGSTAQHLLNYITKPILLVP